MLACSYLLCCSEQSTLDPLPQMDPRSLQYSTESLGIRLSSVSLEALFNVSCDLVNVGPIIVDPPLQVRTE
jgi:hypothetical protein